MPWCGCRPCICGSDPYPYHSMPASEHGTQMGHEFLGVVEELGSEVIVQEEGPRRGVVRLPSAPA